MSALIIWKDENVAMKNDWKLNGFRTFLAAQHIFASTMTQLISQPHENEMNIAFRTYRTQKIGIRGLFRIIIVHLHWNLHSEIATNDTSQLLSLTNEQNRIENGMKKNWKLKLHRKSFTLNLLLVWISLKRLAFQLVSFTLEHNSVLKNCV